MKAEGEYCWLVTRICLVVGILSVFFLLEIRLEAADYSLFVPRTQIDNYFSNESADQHKGFLVDTVGCRIPDLDPMDASIRQFIKSEEPLNCEQDYGPALVESNLNSLNINQNSLAHYNITDITQLHCCYQPFWREEKKKSPDGQYPGNVDGVTRFRKTCTKIVDGALIFDEFVKISCFVNKSLIYTDFHAFTPLKSSQREVEDEDGKKVSVLMVGADAVSRLNLHRQMPQTVNFLLNQLQAVQLLGYNKVGDNTFPNLVPIFTGLFEEELVKTCWPTTDSVFDNCPFIWNTYKNMNYSTAFAEDSSWMGVFNYLKSGFRKQPTDYYMRVYNKIGEEKIGFNKRSNAYLCIGPKSSLETLLDYGYKFAVTMKNFLSFGFFWGTGLTHDYLNLAAQGDIHYKHFFEVLYNEGILNKTILVFMSDHGIRWGDIRKTYQGYLEERLPFIFIVYPEWFKVKYTTAVSNLRKNRHRLTTPFDLHQTLLDLSDLSTLEQNSLKKRTNELIEATTLPRGISWFLPIPESRSCKSAGIIDHWCTCHQSKNIATNSSQVKEATKFLVKYLNSILSPYSNLCEKLSLDKIHIAREEKSNTSEKFDSNKAGIIDYSLLIETVPGNAQFEAKVRYSWNSGKYSVVGSISRINLYGQQSRCIRNYKLRLYCYCK